ncbi:AAA family ATPase [Streptomyces sp. NPDC056362]|uniref:AAA family ATPase n=1 Tax=unclassified Streptomyces TaxID=2593676 RepID=UPI0035D59AE5
MDRLLTAGHGVDAVIGVEGAGKSTLMDARRIAWDATGTTYAGASSAPPSARVFGSRRRPRVWTLR